MDAPTSPPPGSEPPSRDPESAFKYFAFISYSHQDNRTRRAGDPETAPARMLWGNWLHNALETYRVPQAFVGRTNKRGELIPARLIPCFRDEAELPSESRLQTAIEGALRQSRYLIVICSPRSARSFYVNSEVVFFKKLKRSDRILPLIVAGEPNAVRKREEDGDTGECFCPALKHPLRADGTLDESTDEEPICADARWEEEHQELYAGEQRLARATLETALLKLVAGLLGVGFDELVQRERQRQIRVRRQQAGIVAAVMAAILTLAGVAWKQRNDAIDARNKEREQRLLVQQREAEQRQMLHEASMADYATAVQRIDGDGLWAEGVAHLARALDWEPGNALAAIRLYDTMAYYAPEKINLPRRTIVHEDAVTAAEYDPTGRWIVSGTAKGVVQIWDAATGERVAGPIRLSEGVRQVTFSPDGTPFYAEGNKAATIWETATGKAVGAPMEHRDWVVEAAFSPDGQRIVTTSADGTARLWNATTGRPLGEFLRHETGLFSATFSPDGGLLAIAGYGPVWIRNAATGELVGQRIEHTANVDVVTFSPDGKRLATASVDQTARLWEAATGKPLGEPMKHQAAVEMVAFHPDGTRVVTASADGTARLWDATTGKPLSPAMPHHGPVISARFSPDGTHVVTASKDQTARVWDALTGMAVSEPMRHEGAVTRASFSPDGRHILTASADRTLQIWDATYRKPLGMPLRHAAAVRGASFSPDGKSIATVGDDKTGRLWDASSGTPRGEVMPHEHFVGRVEFSPDGGRVLTCVDGPTVALWDAATGRPLGEPMRQPGNNALGAHFSPDGKLIVTGCTDGVARIWDGFTGKPVAEFKGHRRSVVCARFSPNGRRIVTASMDGTAQVWDVGTRQPIGEPLEHGEEVSDANFNPDVTVLVTAGYDKAAHLWNVTTGRPIGEPMRHAGVVNRANFSPDGKRVVTASEDGTARLWDAGTGKPTGPSMRHGLGVSNAAFSPDGRWVVTASVDKTARVWDVATGRQVGESMRAEYAIRSAQFSPDGRRILTSSSYDAARLWEKSATGEELVPVPAHVREWAKAMAGWRFDAGGIMKPVATGERLAQLAAVAPENQAWSRLARWVATDESARSLHPDLADTPRAIAERECDAGTRRSLESALAYDPGIPLARLLLAGVLRQEAAASPGQAFAGTPLQEIIDAQIPKTTDPTLAPRLIFLRDYDLAHLPDDPALWARAARALHEQKGDVHALRALEKLAQLSPEKASALRQELGLGAKD